MIPEPADNTGSLVDIKKR